MLWHHNMLHTSSKVWRAFIPHSPHTLQRSGHHCVPQRLFPDTAKRRHRDLAFTCLLKQTDLIRSPFYYDINNSYSVLLTLKRFNIIAVLRMFTLNFIHVSKQRLFDINRWEVRTMGLSNSQDKLHLPFPALAGKQKNGDKCWLLQMPVIAHYFSNRDMQLIHLFLCPLNIGF